MKSERVFAELLVGHFVLLGENMQRYLRACSFENDVIRYRWTHLIDQLQAELEQTIVGSALITQETIRSREIQMRITLGSNTDILAVFAVLDINRAIKLVHSNPSFVVLVKVGCRRHLCVTIGTLTLGCMSVAETRCATELIVHVQIEETRFALPASSTLDVLLAQTNSRIRITRWCAIQGATDITLAWLTTLRPKVEVVGFATVALLTGHARFALTTTFAVALQRAGACKNVS